MFLPNTAGMLFKRSATYSKTGEATFAAGVRAQCSVVTLVQEIKKTPIRTDASASRGRADEDVSVSLILFPATSTLVLGDKFLIAGLDLRCSGVQPRLDVLGKLDHYECTFEAWSAL